MNNLLKEFSNLMYDLIYEAMTYNKYEVNLKYRFDGLDSDVQMHIKQLLSNIQTKSFFADDILCMNLIEVITYCDKTEILTVKFNKNFIKLSCTGG